MSTHDKLANWARPYLEPDEEIQAVFLVQSVSPYWILISILIGVFSDGYRTVVVTDRAIVLLRNGRMLGARPKEVAQRRPRDEWLGDPKGIWGRVQLDRKYWVHKRFHKEVVAADTALQAMLDSGALLPPQ
jgi:hypothetical protein